MHRSTNDQKVLHTPLIPSGTVTELVGRLLHGDCPVLYRAIGEQAHPAA